MAKVYVKGVQSQKVVACVKHFALNNQEQDRMSVSADVSERTRVSVEVSVSVGMCVAYAPNFLCPPTQWELYYPAFKAAVDVSQLPPLLM
jgi:hypothetical protein